ncbi:MAG: hypothetical protein DRQ49_09015 [Gammaproteobacteria bacterium]|nr:MAG: hypothetical protein DRQ49_09015 [Gammaproteobacteria bacterium]RKZ41745.1 MAG: hypothetical protein DRQ41_07895 [Gammaproteobacteria bacterium]RKZ75998.1 MAG: hypothetical protein DRQ57_05440 [Gammaproteobacteria bacterium]
MKKTNNTKNKADQVVTYQTNDNSTVIEVSFAHDTVWLTQAQMMVLFGKFCISWLKITLS